jgi:nicotinate-nucleotide pyrophosphorylase (carboxylating)
MYKQTPAYLTPEALDHFISEALAEDIGPGDYSTLSAVPADLNRKAILKVKSDGILAGMEMARLIFESVDPDLEFIAFLKDGDEIKSGDLAFEVAGKAQSILSAERLVLNCMQRMSGIATKTRKMADLIRHTSAKLLDTRKTSPNSRIIEKWAVAIGGGQNHRFALYDMIMLKDNHVDYAGGIAKALDAAKQFVVQNNIDLQIEIETRNLTEVLEVLAHGGADIIMLDNFPLEDLRTAVESIDRRIPIEASGNVNESTIVAIAETGVDFISVGALTHSYQSLDLSLKAFSSH